MDALPARGADRREVVERRDDGGAPRVCQGGKLERQVEDVVDVDDVGLGRPDHVVERGTERGGPPGVFEGVEGPVVDDLGDRQALVHPPRHGAVRPRRVELRAEHGHVVTLGEGAAEGRGVNLRACLVPGQEIVDGVQDPKRPPGHWGGGFVRGPV